MCSQRDSADLLQSQWAFVLEQRMIGPDGKVALAALQGRDMKLVFFSQATNVDHRHVKVTASHEWKEVEPVIIRDPQPNFGMTANNPADSAVNQLDANIGSDSDLQLSLIQPFQQIHFSAEIVRSRHDLLCIFEKDCSSIGHVYVACAALEDPHSSLPFQRLDTAR